MPTLRLYLLGSPRVERNGDQVNVPRRKALALLAYLAVTGDAHQRDTLATLLWPDSDPALSYSYLRRDLAVLNKAIGGSWLEADRETIELVASDGFWLDVEEFRELLTLCRAHGHSGDGICPQCVPLLSKAATLYRGEFMAGFSLADSPVYDEWQRYEGEALCRELAGALRKLVRGHSARGEFEAAISYARRWLELDAWHEPAHRQLMQLYAWTGNSAAALRQYQACARVLEGELGQVPEEATCQLLESIRSGRPPAPPYWEEGTPSWPVVPQHNLPAQPTPIIGREADLAEISRLLRDPDCRMLTLVGPGGIGKTRLALEAAERALDDHPDGVCLVTLASVSSAELLVPTIADALALSPRGRADLREQLLNYLREKNTLLVIDNFEHLLDGTDLLADILDAAPHVKLLVTSRERLNLHAEWVREVKGLAFPDDEGLKATGDIILEDYGAVALFLETVWRVCPGLQLTETDRAAVARICQLLEGLPLGIELAAAWARMMPLPEIADEIGRSLDILATSLRDVPVRHRSLRALFEHSWQLLSESERCVVKRVSAFQGGFRREAAQQVAGAPLPMLSALVDKSMLRGHRSGRYDMHQLLRQFVVEKLQETPKEHREAGDRHSRYYAAYLQERESRLRGSEQREALAEIASEIDNVRAGWRWAVAYGKMTELAQSLESLHLFYYERGWVQEGEEVFRDALASLSSQATADERVVGRLRARQGRFAYRQGHYRRAMELLHRSLEAFDGPQAEGQTAAGRERAFSLFSLSVILRADGAYREARRLDEESLEIYRQSGDRAGTAMALKQLGIISGSLGRYPEAQVHLQEALALYQEIGDPYGIANTLNDLGIVAVWLGQRGEARRLYQECLAMRRQLGDMWGIGTSLNNLGYLAYLDRAYAEAERLLGESLAIQRQIGDRYHIANCLSNLGSAVCALGECQRAGPYLYEGLRLAAEIGADPLILEVLAGIATLMAEGEPADMMQAARLFTFVRDHSASDEPTMDQAERGLAKMAPHLPPEALAEAREQGARRELDAVVAEVLGWGKPGRSS